MAAKFFDTNVLLYLLGHDSTKADCAEELVRQGGIISVQVLNEIAHVGRRKMQLSWSDLHDLLRSLRETLAVVPVTVETHEAGLAIAERYGLSTYDALIVGAATIEGCEVLWSEDMGDGLRIRDRLVIKNPFRDAKPSSESSP